MRAAAAEDPNGLTLDQKAGFSHPRGEHIVAQAPAERRECSARLHQAKDLSPYVHFRYIVIPLGDALAVRRIADAAVERTLG